MQLKVYQHVHISFPAFCLLRDVLRLDPCVAKGMLRAIQTRPLSANIALVHSNACRTAFARHLRSSSQTKTLLASQLLSSQL